jgi:DNA-nicking Smr family endonuclease
VSKKQRDLTVEEKNLWRRVAASLKMRRALPQEDEHADEPKPARRASSAPVVKTATPARSPPQRPPQLRGNEKRVRRGRLEIGAKLDLHGHTQESGRAALARFVRAAQARGERTVIVITGMGRGGEGILKRRLPEWLAESDLRPLISGYAPAHRVHGGGGAFYVFLKRGD